MKKWCWVVLCSCLIVGCTTVSPDEPTIIFATNADWPENFHFCRPKSDGSGTSDCWHIQSVEDWLALEPVLGERIPTWPEDGPLPPLPEGLAWDYIPYQDNGASTYIWTIVATE